MVGFACACMVNTCVWAIAASYEGTRRARALGVSAALVSYTGLASTIIGGFLAHRGGWPLAFAQYPVFGGIEFAAALLSLRNVRPEHHRTPQAAEAYFTRLLPFYLMVTFLTAIVFMGATQFAFLLEADGIHDPAARSLIMGARTMIAALTGLSYGLLRRRLGNQGLLTFAMISMALALSALASGTYVAFPIAGAILMGIYTGLLGPYLYEAVIERSSAQSRGRAIGMSSGFGYVGAFLNPIIFAPMSAVLGLRSVFFVMAVVMGLAAMGSVLNANRRRRVAPEQELLG
jgi:MFS family permease